MKRSAFVFFTILVSLFAYGVFRIYSDPEFHELLTSVHTLLPSPEISQILGSKDEQLFEHAIVKRAVDGDTIELSDGRKVRYIGMDTPELHHPEKGEQCFGREAWLRNRQLVEGKEVFLEKDVSETDHYGRLLRYVWLDQQFVNKQLVAEGYAFARSYPPDIARQTELREAEASASAQNIGMWSGCPR